MGTIILSALVAHTGWHWMTERAGQLSEFGWPALDASFAASAMRWMMLILVFAGFVWLAHQLMRRRADRSAEKVSAQQGPEPEDAQAADSFSDQRKSKTGISRLFAKVLPAGRAEDL
jgi:TRAP-type C4-dicarboxylate transport system permease small subunit